MRNRFMTLKMMAPALLLAMLAAACGDGGPKVEKLTSEQAEAVKKVNQDRGVLTRYQSLARGQYNVNEYAQSQYFGDWEALAGMPKNKREEARKVILDKAQKDINKRRAEFESLISSYRDNPSQLASASLRRAASDNLNLGVRITLSAVERQEKALRERQKKFNLNQDKMDAEKRKAEEDAINKQREACNKRKSDINLVKANQEAVVATAIKQASPPAPGK